MGQAAVIPADFFALAVRHLPAAISTLHAMVLLVATPLFFAPTLLFTLALGVVPVVSVRPTPAAALLITRLSGRCGSSRLRNMPSLGVSDGRTIDERRLSFVDSTMAVADFAADGAGSGAIVACGAVRSLRVRGNREDRNEECGSHDAG